MMRTRSVLVTTILFSFAVGVAAQSPDLIDQATAQGIVGNAFRSEAPFDLTGVWELFIPKSAAVMTPSGPPKRYLDIGYVSRLVLLSDGSGTFQDLGGAPQKITWHHATAGTYFQLLINATTVIQLNYFSSLPYELQEASPNVWRSLNEAFAIAEVETELLSASMDYMDKKISSDSWKQSMSKLSPLRKSPNIVSVPLLLSVLNNGVQKGDSVYAILTRHNLVIIGG